MKRIPLFIIILVLFCQCSAKQDIESAIKDVYGKNIPGETKDNTTLYKLDYIGKENNQDKDVVKLKDKIDNILNVLAETVGNDIPSNSDANSSATTKVDCLSNVYKWETPSIRIILISKKCIGNKGRSIDIIVTNKT